MLFEREAMAVHAERPGAEEPEQAHPRHQGQHHRHAQGRLDQRQGEHPERGAHLGDRSSKARARGAQLRGVQLGGQDVGGAVRPHIHEQVEHHKAEEHQPRMRRIAPGEHGTQPQRRHAEGHAAKADELHANAPELRHRPQADDKAEQQKHIDQPRAACQCCHMRNQCQPLARHMHLRQQHGGEQPHAIGRDIHQKPGDGAQQSAAQVGRMK